MRAGKRAKDNSAFHPAGNFLWFGIELLPADAWESEYELAFELYKQAVQCEFLRGNFEKAEELYPKIIEKTRTIPEKISIWCIKLVQLEQQQRCIFLYKINLFQ